MSEVALMRPVATFAAARNFCYSRSGEEKGDDAAKIGLNRSRQSWSARESERKEDITRRVMAKSIWERSAAESKCTVCGCDVEGEMMGIGKESATGQVLEARSDDEGWEGDGNDETLSTLSSKPKRTSAKTAP
jgi:hypothetical protein